MKKICYFIPIFLLSLTSLTACNKSNELVDQVFQDYQVDNAKFFNVEKEKYGIFIYSDGCSHCENVKLYLVDYIVSEKQNNLPIYLYNISTNEVKFNEFSANPGTSANENIEACIQQSINATSLDQIYLNGTPTIYIIGTDNNSKHIVTSGYIGENQVKNFLTSSSYKAPLIIAIAVTGIVFLLGIAVFFYIRKRRQEK